MNESNTITVQIGKKSRNVAVPRSWDDLDDRTALLFYNTLFTNAGSEFTHADFTAVKLISLTQHILGFSADMMSKWEAEYLQKDAANGQLVFLAALKEVLTVALGGLFDIQEDEETGATTYAVKFNRTKNPWPALNRSTILKGGKKKTTWYYAPKDGLENITLYELAYTFSTYETYLSAGDEQYAHLLIGALYRPSRPETAEERASGWHGDRRQPLRRYEDKVQERAKHAATLPTLTRRFLVFWFAGCREMIAQQYPKVFKRNGDGGKGGANYGWGGLLLKLAETGTFGALDQTADQHFSNALTYLSMKDDERVEQERAMERARKK